MISRRSALRALAVGSLSSLNIWVPRIAIAQITGDPREAIVKARDVLIDNFGHEKKEHALDYVATHNTKTTSTVTQAVASLQREAYSNLHDDVCRVSTNKSKTQLMFGGSKSNQLDHCGVYINHGLAGSTTAYVADVPFVCHSFLVERAARSWGENDITRYLYPSRTVEYFQTLWDTPEPKSTHIHCEDGIWVTEYKASHGRSGRGTFGLLKRESGEYIYKQEFDYNLS